MSDTNIIIDETDNLVNIPRFMFEDVSKISNGSFRLYVLFVVESLSNNKELFKGDVLKKLNIGDTTFHRNIKPLIELGFINTINSYKKGKEKYSYILSTKSKTDPNLFFKVSDISTIEAYKVLTKEEMRMYYYFLYLVQADDSLAERSLEDVFGKSSSTTKKIKKSLIDKDFLVEIERK